MPHDMFADCDLSPLCPAHSFTVILLLLRGETLNYKPVAKDDHIAGRTAAKMTGNIKL